jgi:hypothetical protein
MPGSPVSHGVVSEIAYCVDGLSTDRIDVFVQKGMKENALDGREGLGRETIIKGQPGRRRRFCAAKSG